jgi:hypothetical protein
MHETLRPGEWDKFNKRPRKAESHFQLKYLITHYNVQYVMPWTDSEPLLNLFSVALESSRDAQHVRKVTQIPLGRLGAAKVMIDISGVLGAHATTRMSVFHLSRRS